MSAERDNVKAAESAGEEAERAVADESGGAAGCAEASNDAGVCAGQANDVTAQGAAADESGSDDAGDAEDAPSEEELAAARELAEHNALADVFDDVRKQSADSHLVTPDRWPEIGLVPDHMTAEDFEMFVYEWLEDYQTEHKDEIEAERAAERAKAASVRSAKRTGVGCPPKIPNRRLAQIEADEKAKEAEQVASAAAAAESSADGGDGSVAAGAENGAAGSTVKGGEAAGASAASPADAASASSPSLSETVDEEASGAAVDSAEPSAASPSASDSEADDDDASPFAGLHIPEGYKLEQIEGQWTLVPDEDAAPVRKEIKCNRIKVLMGMHSYYLYDETLMTSSYAHWAFLAAEDNPVVTFVECVREDARVYPRPYPAVCLKNPPFRMSDEQIEQTWQAVRDSGNYPDIERTQASNGDVYYYSTKYLAPEYAASLAEYDAVERPADV